MRTARRIQLGILAVVFVVVSVFGVGVVLNVRGALIEQLDDQIRLNADAIASIEPTSEISATDLLEGIGDQPRRTLALLIFDPAGRLVVASPSGVGDDDDPLPDAGGFGVDALRARVGGDPFTIDAVADGVQYRAAAIDLDGDLAVVALTTSEVEAAQRRIGFIMFLSSIASVVLIGVATSWVIRRAIDPIDEMIDTAAAVGRGDLSVRIDTATHDPDVRRLSDSLNDMLGQLETAFADRAESQERLRQFVADASHELRTPLATIRGYAELYLSGAAAEAETTERAMDRIRSESIRTATLVDDLLLLARMDELAAGIGPDPDRTRIDMTRLVTDVVADARAIEPGRSIDLALPDAAVQIEGVEAELRQVFVNLLANTRAHAPDAPVAVELRSISGGGVEVVVADEGPGLSADQAMHVFDRFWRADGSRSRATGGAGLGLAISDAIVRAHDGTIVIDAAPGAGARFTVRLPAGAGAPMAT